MIIIFTYILQWAEKFRAPVRYLSTYVARREKLIYTQYHTKETTEKYLIWLYEKHQHELPRKSQLEVINYLKNYVTFPPNSRYTKNSTYISRSIVQSVTVNYTHKRCSVCDGMHEIKHYTNKKNKKLFELAVLPYTFYTVCDGCSDLLNGALLMNSIEDNIKNAKRARLTVIYASIRYKFGADLSKLIFMYINIHG